MLFAALRVLSINKPPELRSLFTPPANSRRSVLQEEEVEMATVIYLVVAVVGVMFIAISLVSLQSSDR